MNIDSRFPSVSGAPSSGGGTPAGTSPLPVIAGSGAPTDGVTGAGVLPPGGFYRDADNGQYYTNVGTLEAPAFQLLIQA